MYSFVLGFQRLVGCAKGTPAASSSFMVMLAKLPPIWIASLAAALARIAQDFHSETRPVVAGAEQIRSGTATLQPVPGTTRRLQRNLIIPGVPPCPADKGGAPTDFYRFENWKRLRAPFWPYFLRSFMRASRVRKPSAFILLRNSALKSWRARARPMRTASAWPWTPPPLTFAMTLKVELVSVRTSGDFAD